MFVINDEYAYVGQSVDVEKRIEKHKRLLNEKKHPNVNLVEDIKSIDFYILEECSISKLNEYEKLYYEKIASKYIMLNKRECGIQGTNGVSVVFKGNDNPNLTFSNGSFYINEIRISKYEKLYCLSELVDYIRNNSNYDIRINRVLDKYDFIDRINVLCNTNISKERNVASQLKKLGIYKVLGARRNKKVYCSFSVFITFAFYSCPQFAASICIMIGDMI